MPGQSTAQVPVRDGATFSGTGVDPTLTVDGIVYTIHGDDDLTPGSTQVIAEHPPALDAGMPALDTGYSYRTFYLQNAQSSMPNAFLSIQLTIP